MQRCDDQDLVIYYVIRSSFLSDHSPYAIGPLSVCPVCLSVTLVCCGQIVGRIKMKLGTKVGLGPGHIVLDGDPSPSKAGGQQAPLFGPCIVAKRLH